MFTISNQTKIKFYESFEKTEKSVEEDVEIIKNWMKTQPHLPEIMSDVKIKNFLNMNKFSIEKTKQKIDMYYTMRTIMPGMFLNPKLPSIQQVYDYAFLAYHPKLVNDIHRVFLWTLKKEDIDCMEENMILFFSIFEVRLLEDFIMDDIIVIDFSNVHLKDMMKFTPSVMQKLFSIYQKVYSMRFHKLYYINCPPYITHVVTILKSILKQKVFERIEIFPNADILKQLFAEDDIPKDFGGNGPTLESQSDLMRETIKRYQNHFDHLDTLKVNEDLRPEKLDNDELLGYYGSFKKIDID